MDIDIKAAVADAIEYYRHLIEADVEDLDADKVRDLSGRGDVWHVIDYLGVIDAIESDAMDYLVEDIRYEITSEVGDQLYDLVSEVLADRLATTEAEED